MNITGFTDEAAPKIEEQINVCRELGWNRIDLRNIDNENITEVDDRRFEEIKEALERAGLSVIAFGSRIANWGRRVSDPFETDLAELKRAIPRMQAMGTRYIRIMSYRAPEGPLGTQPEIEEEILRRLTELSRIAEENGIVCIHENCETWGGQSFEHTRFLLENIASPSFRLVYDSGNPFWNNDVRGTGPYIKQDALEFYRQVKDAVEYVHIKDGRLRGETEEYTFPGEGDGKVEELLAELKRDGYDRGLSIEPHMAVVFHDPSIQSDAEYRRSVFMEYGKRMRDLCLAAGFSVP